MAWPDVEPLFPLDGEARKNYQLEMTRGESLNVRNSRRQAARTAANKRWNGKAAPKEPPLANKDGGAPSGRQTI